MAVSPPTRSICCLSIRRRRADKRQSPRLVPTAITTARHHPGPLISFAQNISWINEKYAKVLAYRAYGGRIDERDDLAKLRDNIKSTLKIIRLCVGSLHPVWRSRESVCVFTIFLSNRT